jgi:hypothetical protein
MSETCNNSELDDLSATRIIPKRLIWSEKPISKY